MAERPGYVLHQHLRTVRQGNGYATHATSLPLVVLIQKKLCLIKVAFYFLKQKLLFEPPLGELRGNVCTPSIARWKARG